ncbi:MAG: methyltransferase domain-containing protein [Bacteroidales bacterium]|nr:methyltransferase domain-containing protein [Bacteroidales bacterium]
MSKNFGSDKKSALQSKFDAQKIAFAPVMFQAAKAMRDLGILELLMNNRKKGADIEYISEQLNLPVYGVKVLLEAGLSLEMVRLEDEKYLLTKTGYFILRDELTRVNMDFVNDVNYKGMFFLQDAIKSGKPEGLKVFGKWDTVYEALSELPPKVQESWFNFDHYYSDYAFPDILPIIFEDKPEKILDIGGNTGKFAIKCVEYSDKVNVIILDLPGQLKVADKNIKEHGFEKRIKGHHINLLEHSNPFPKEYDIIWMSQFLDCFSQEDVYQLLKRAYEAMDNNSSLYIMETYWDNQKFEASTYSLHATSLYFTCIANGCSQMYHTEDMLKLIEKAGLFVEKEFNDIGVSHTLYKCKKK